MLGAIAGDIVGSRFEHANFKSKEFELLNRNCFATDDSIMTLAIAQAFLESGGDCAKLGEHAIANMQLLGNHYPHAGYGGNFRRWLRQEASKPYNSFGNGAARRHLIWSIKISRPVALQKATP